jgi:hypothetical protein
MSPDNFISRIKSTEDNIFLISIFHLHDVKVLQSLEKKYFEHITVSVVDSEMFPVQIMVKDFLRIIERNCRKLTEQTAGKNIFLWYEQKNINDVIDSLGFLNLSISGLIIDQINFKISVSTEVEIFTSEYLRNSMADIFLILSSSIFNTHKSTLRNFGYHPGENCLVWESANEY